MKAWPAIPAVLSCEPPPLSPSLQHMLVCLPQVKDMPAALISFVRAVDAKVKKMFRHGYCR